MQLSENIEVSRAAMECYRYLLDFSRSQEWDPGVVRAKRLDRVPLAPGARFSVSCKLPLGSITLLYTLEDACPGELIQLRGECRFFSVKDTIRFKQVDTSGGPAQTHIHYRAEFDFHSLPDAIVKRSGAGLERMGRRAVKGLRTALQDKFDAPVQSGLSQLSDKLVLPGMAHFSKLGYVRSRPKYNPMSADVSGKHMLITGASSGLGLAAARELAYRGAHLSLVVRNIEKGQQVIDEIRNQTGNEHLRLLQADMSLLGDTDQLIDTLLSSDRPLDVLINNAGALFDAQRDTSEGFDESMALLLLTPLKLMHGVKPLLRRATDSRVINVVSGGMYSQRLNLAILLAPAKDNYAGSVAYAQAKRALMIATEELAEPWQQLGITVNAMHPGWADTAGVRDSLPEFYRLTKKILRTPEQGADTIVWLSVATEALKLHGKLFLDRTPRDLYLMRGTREDSRQRALLMDCLDDCRSRADWERKIGGDPQAAAV